MVDYVGKSRLSWYTYRDALCIHIFIAVCLYFFAARLGTLRNGASNLITRFSHIG